MTIAAVGRRTSWSRTRRAPPVRERGDCGVAARRDREKRVADHQGCSDAGDQEDEHGHRGEGPGGQVPDRRKLAQRLAGGEREPTLAPELARLRNRLEQPLDRVTGRARVKRQGADEADDEGERRRAPALRAAARIEPSERQDKSAKVASEASKGTQIAGTRPDPEEDAESDQRGCRRGRCRESCRAPIRPGEEQDEAEGDEGERRRDRDVLVAEHRIAGPDRDRQQRGGAPDGGESIARQRPHGAADAEHGGEPDQRRGQVSDRVGVRLGRDLADALDAEHRVEQVGENVERGAVDERRRLDPARIRLSRGEQVLGDVPARVQPLVEAQGVYVVVDPEPDLTAAEQHLAREQNQDQAGDDENHRARRAGSEPLQRAETATLHRAPESTRSRCRTRDRSRAAATI